MLSPVFLSAINCQISSVIKGMNGCSMRIKASRKPILARYVSHETGRLLQERHKLWGELGVAQEKQGQGITGQDEYVSFLRSELARIEKLLADAAEDQHYVQEALNGIGC